MSMFVFFDRQAVGDRPAGVTVSKKKVLPKGNFRIDERIWGSTTLWFVHKDKFTADEREQAYRIFRRLREVNKQDTPR